MFTTACKKRSTEPKLSKWLASPIPEIYLQNEFLTLDLETTSINGTPSALEESNEILMAGWAVNNNNDAVSIQTNEYSLDFLLWGLYRPNLVVAHNAKFELQ